MKKRIAILFLLSMFLSTVHAESNYQTIQQIKADTPERWVQTYETTWRTISVDVPIQVPNVDAVPIIRVKRKDKMDGDLISDYPVIQNYTGYLVLYSDKAFYDYDPPLNISRQKLGVFSRDEIPNVTPEYNDIPYEQALAFCYDTFATLGINAKDELLMKDVTVWSGFYKTQKMNGKKIYTEYQSGTGMWSFDFVQQAVCRR